MSNLSHYRRVYSHGR